MIRQNVSNKKESRERKHSKVKNYIYQNTTITMMSLRMSSYPKEDVLIYKICW